MNSNELLRKNATLCQWWTGVVRDPQFQQIALLAQAELANGDNLDQIKGGRKMLETLEQMPISPEPDFRIPDSGFNHEPPAIVKSQTRPK